MTPSSSVSFASYGQSGHAGPAAMPPAGGPVSGEGFRYATAGRRVLALLIDMACVAAVCAAVMFADADIDGEPFADKLIGLLGDPAERDRMRAAARGLAQDQAAVRLADAVEGLRR